MSEEAAKSATTNTTNRVKKIDIPTCICSIHNILTNERIRTRVQAVDCGIVSYFEWIERKIAFARC